ASDLARLSPNDAFDRPCAGVPPGARLAMGLRPPRARARSRRPRDAALTCAPRGGEDRAGPALSAGSERRLRYTRAMPASDFEPVIGLEVHCQLKTKSKAFCACPVVFGACPVVFGAPPNTAVCPVCLGYPGVLPAVNREMVTLAMRVALATGCTIEEKSVFARKNYFYPDLPKGYQISQYARPLATRGAVALRADGSP